MLLPVWRRIGLLFLLLLAGKWAVAQQNPKLASTDESTMDALYQSLKAESRNPSKREDNLIGADQLIAEALKFKSKAYLGRGYYIKGVAQSGGNARVEGLESLKNAQLLLADDADTLLFGKICYSIAATEYLLEYLEDAQRDLERAISIIQAIGDTSTLTLSYGLMGMIQKELGNFEVAVDYLEQGMEAADERGRHYLLQNLGVTYKENEDYPKARACFLEVAEYYKEKKMLAELGIALNNLATVELRLENPRAAQEYLNQALKLVPLGNSSRLNALVHVNLGVAKEKMKDFHGAIQEYVFARGILTELNEHKNLALTMENEANCRYLIGESRRAYELLDSAKTISDSLLTEGRAESIAELEQKYRQSSQKQRIEDLKKENAIIQERNAAVAQSASNQRLAVIFLVVVILLLVVLGFLLLRLQRTRYLRRSEADKQLLLRQQIKPHFIFNAMNSIQHFLVNDHKKEGLQYLGKFGSLLRLILNNSEHDLVPIAEEILLIRHYLEMEQIRTNQKFSFEIDLDPQVQADEVLMPGMVLQVLVENAIWHGIAGKEGRGLIKIVIGQRNGQLQVAVEDDGLGLKVSQAKDPSMRKSFGLELVRKRIERVHWHKVSYQFQLEERKDAQGRVLGAVARILFKGKIAY